jgi:hypothetical protein
LVDNAVDSLIMTPVDNVYVVGIDLAGQEAAADPYANYWYNLSESVGGLFKVIPNLRAGRGGCELNVVHIVALHFPEGYAISTGWDEPGH